MKRPYRAAAVHLEPRVQSTATPYSFVMTHQGLGMKHVQSLGACVCLYRVSA